MAFQIQPNKNTEFKMVSNIYGIKDFAANEFETTNYIKIKMDKVVSLFNYYSKIKSNSMEYNRKNNN